MNTRLISPGVGVQIIDENVSAPTLRPEDIARTAHEANRAFCRCMGDLSQPCWDDAPQWQRDSATNGVIFHFENPDAQPSASHECWLAEKRAAGWRYGPIKNPDAKEHPCFVEYDELPQDQKAKDYIFGAICKTLIDVAGWRS